MTRWPFRALESTVIVALATIALSSPTRLVAQQPRTTVTRTPLALVGGTLIDGTGAAPVRDSVVLIVGDRVEKVGTVATLSVPAGYTKVSTEGMTVLPGLWDPHVHLIYGGHPDLIYWLGKYAPQFERVTIPASAQQMLLAGVTSVRDLGAPYQSIVAVRKQISSGALPGPTIYTAGMVLMNGAPPVMTHVWSVSDAADATAKTRTLLDAGMDIIKVANAEQIGIKPLRAIVTEAHSRKRKVTAHGRTDAEIRLGLAAGVDEFQHIGTASAEFPTDIVEAIRTRVKSGPPLYWSLTVGAQLNESYLASNPELLEDPSAFVGLPAAIEADVRQAIAKRQAAKPDPRVRSIIKRKVSQLRSLGVRFVFGSDVGGFGANTTQGTWLELDAWVRELGTEPLRALKYATQDAADYMGAGRDAGSIAAGQYADVIAVKGDPLRSMSALREPALVVKHGRRYK